MIKRELIFLETDILLYLLSYGPGAVPIKKESWRPGLAQSSWTPAKGGPSRHDDADGRRNFQTGASNRYNRIEPVEPLQEEKNDGRSEKGHRDREERSWSAWNKKTRDRSSEPAERKTSYRPEPVRSWGGQDRDRKQDRRASPDYGVGGSVDRRRSRSRDR
jgi:hypothetical protein